MNRLTVVILCLLVSTITQAADAPPTSALADIGQLVVNKLVQGDIHKLHLPGLHDATGHPLPHDVAYYTLNEVPKP